MQLLENISLQPYNTFGIDVKARYFLTVADRDQLYEITYNADMPQERHVIGGGSNILLTKDVDGLTIHNCIKGIEWLRETDEYVWLKVGSGEVWHDFVMYAIRNNWAGIENLALIPGTVGAAPMQNIGAYGVEVKHVTDNVTGWHWDEKRYVSYPNKACRFGYRDSIFKQELKNKVFITEVTFRLNKQPVYNTSYGAIQQELDNKGITTPSIKAIAEAVIAIRRSKLPDPKQTGNAGSFFKNPTIPVEHYQQLKNHYPEMPSYPVSQDEVKVPAGWLIEQCGYKGYKTGHTGVHSDQALVLVNHGDANGKEVWDLSEAIMQTVQQKYRITLEREVQVW